MWDWRHNKSTARLWGVVAAARCVCRYAAHTWGCPAASPNMHTRRGACLPTPSLPTHPWSTCVWWCCVLCVVCALGVCNGIYNVIYYMKLHYESIASNMAIQFNPMQYYTFHHKSCYTPIPKSHPSAASWRRAPRSPPQSVHVTTRCIWVGYGREYVVRFVAKRLGICIGSSCDFTKPHK